MTAIPIVLINMLTGEERPRFSSSLRLGNLKEGIIACSERTPAEVFAVLCIVCLQIPEMHFSGHESMEKERRERLACTATMSNK